MTLLQFYNNFLLIGGLLLIEKHIRMCTDINNSKKNLRLMFVKY